MRLLIVGSLEGHVASAARIALARGAQVNQVDSLAQAMQALRSGQGGDLVMIDAVLDVGRLISQLESEHITVPVVACGVGSDAKAAVRAIKAGAKEYVPLPPDAELIAAVLQAVSDESSEFVFRDPAMQQVAAMAEQIAPSDATVLITGESGTGKEVMARFVHARSGRADKPFVSVNCAAIPDNLLESELFGHEKGAFTGAVSRRVGKFEEANDATLLLDEISEMDIRLQAKLLRVIQEREIDRVGGTKPVKVNIRLIATSNRDLEGSVRGGEFREDLYYRLNVINLELPPLRDRPGDIRFLAEHFVRKYAEANGVTVRPLSDEAHAKMLNHPWFGNVRELENTLHRAVLIATGTRIAPEHILLSGATKPLSDRNAATAATLPPATMPPQRPMPPPRGAYGMSTPPPAATGGADPSAAGSSLPPAQTAGESSIAALVGRTVADVERDLILETLTSCLGNRTHAATILGISIRTLRNKLKLYSDQGISVPAPGSG